MAGRQRSIVAGSADRYALPFIVAGVARKTAAKYKGAIWASTPDSPSRRRHDPINTVATTQQPGHGRETQHHRGPDATTGFGGEADPLDAVPLAFRQCIDQQGSGQCLAAPARNAGDVLGAVRRIVQPRIKVQPTLLEVAQRQLRDAAECAGRGVAGVEIQRLVQDRQRIGSAVRYRQDGREFKVQIDGPGLEPHRHSLVLDGLGELALVSLQRSRPGQRHRQVAPRDRVVGDQLDGLPELLDRLPKPAPAGQRDPAGGMGIRLVPRLVEGQSTRRRHGGLGRGTSLVHGSCAPVPQV